MDLQLLNEMRHIAGLPELTEAPLSRSDVEGNIKSLLQSIKVQTQQIVAACEQNESMIRHVGADKWGIQGNLVHVSRTLGEILDFISGMPPVPR